MPLNVSKLRYFVFLRSFLPLSDTKRIKKGILLRSFFSNTDTHCTFLLQHSLQGVIGDIRERQKGKKGQRGHVIRRRKERIR